MEDTFVDCPTYEQSFWIGDSRTSSLMSYYLFGSYDLVKRCLMLAAKSLERSEFPEAQVPTGCNTILTAWSLLWIVACREYWQFTGDTDFMKEIYPFLVKTIDNFSKYINKDGLLQVNAWNLLDWAAMDTPADGIVAHQNAFLVKAIKDVAYISKILGHDSDIDKFVVLAENIKLSINFHLWDESQGAYIDCIHSDGRKSCIVSQQTNLVIYLCGCATVERSKIIKRYLLNVPNSFVKIGSPFMTFFHYEALLKEDQTQNIKYILDDIKEKWSEMLDYDATTCWETFLGFYKYTLTRSHCHAWSAVPSYFLPAYILGVRPLEPGFSKVIIRPELSWLKWANGTIPTPKGTISIKVNSTEEGINIDIIAPKGIECVIDSEDGRIGKNMIKYF
jgi:alpha-L-rhamnosidase